MEEANIRIDKLSLKSKEELGMQGIAISEALTELRDMCGLDKLKHAIADHVQLLLVEPLDINEPMHCIISGKPGVGKTTVASIIARIWFALRHGNNLNSNSKICSNSENSNLKVASVLAKKIHNTVEFLKKQNESRIDQNTKNIWKSLDYACGTLTKHLNSSIGKENEKNVKMPNEAYVIAGRETFIGQYQGHTTKITMDFLEKNVGKIIIIEEAYTLSIDRHDTYGAELLMIINRHMTEKPHLNSFIFCGYPDMMKTNLFSAQPGLERRFSWRFNIPDYTPKDLGSIFTKQISKGRWAISIEEEQLTHFFASNTKNFKDGGGDTERLALSCRLAAADFGISKNGAIIITPEIFDNGYKRYIEHSKI